MILKKSIFSIVVGALFIAGCASTPPSNTDNLCSIFQEKDSWYVSAHKVHDKYGIPINVAMSIMKKEPPAIPFFLLSVNSS